MNVRLQAGLSLFNTATAALALFLVFRLGFQHAGPEFMGLWALLSGLMMFARIADTGASVSIARLAAIGARTNGPDHMGPYLWAGLTVAVLPTIVLATVISLITLVVMRATWADHGLSDLLNLTIGTAWLYALGNSFAGVLSGCLDGSGRMAWRYLGGGAANLVLVGIALVLLPSAGPKGFLVAQIVYVAVQTAIYIGIILACRFRLATTWAPYVATVKESFQFISKSIVLGAARTGFEPVSKMLIGYFGGLAAVALFDLAVRVSSQLRQLVNSPLQPIAVLTARSTAALDKAHQGVIERWMLICLVAGFAAAMVQIASAPLVSALVLGRLEPDFVTMSIIFAVSFFINFAGTVAYYVVMASGRLRALIIVHLVMAALNILLGAALGWLWGALGVTLAWGVTLAIGGPAVLGLYLKDHTLGRKNRRRALLLFFGSFAMLLATAAGVIAFQGRFFPNDHNQKRTHSVYTHPVAPNILTFDNSVSSIK